MVVCQEHIVYPWFQQQKEEPVSFENDDPDQRLCRLAASQAMNSNEEKGSDSNEQYHND